MNPQVIKLKNDSALVYVTSALWSSDDQQLVAATLASNAYETLRAVYASLVTNSAKTLFLSYPSSRREEQTVIKGARRGYVNARGSGGSAAVYTASLLHPLAGDPATLPKTKPPKKDEKPIPPFFYVAAQTGEDLPAKFEQRLAIALAWGTRPEWAAYLIEAGREAKLVSHLSASVSRIDKDEDTGPEFVAGLRVIIDKEGWREVIADGLRCGDLRID